MIKININIINNRIEVHYIKIATNIIMMIKIKILLVTIYLLKISIGVNLNQVNIILLFLIYDKLLFLYSYK